MQAGVLLLFLALVPPIGHSGASVVDIAWIGFVLSCQKVESHRFTFHGASFILHAHTNLEPDSEDIEKIIIELPSKLQVNLSGRTEIVHAFTKNLSLCRDTPS